MPALATAGNLLFSSQVDGTFEAVDVDTLDVLWSVNLGSPISAPPMTYSVDTSKLSFSTPAGPAPSGDG